MAVAFDAKATANAFDSPALTASSPLNNTNLTIGVGATALVATVNASAASGVLPTVTGVTWNGVALSLIGTKTQSDSLGSISIYGLASPASGNHTLAVSFTGANSATTLAVHCASFTGTATTTVLAFPTADVKTDASTPAGSVYPTTAFSVTTVNGDMVVGSMTNNSVDFTALSAGTILLHDATMPDGLMMWGYHAAAGATTTFQFSSGGSAICCGVAIHIAQPASSTPVIPHDFTPAFAKRQLPTEAHIFRFYVELAKEDIPKYRWFEWLSEPVRPRPTPLPAADHPFLAWNPVNPETQLVQFFESRWHYAWSEPSVKTKPGLATADQQFLAESLVVAAPGPGTLLWYMPLSGVLMINTIGSD